MRSILPALFILPVFATAQVLVSDQPMNRTVLLEEYTAIRCGNCPAGHVISGNIFAAHGTDVVGVEVHGGGLAVPQGAQPDFRTADGAALWSQYAVAFQPQGMVNRGGLVQPSNYSSATNAALAMPSPVNIGLATTFDPDSRMLNVEVELYYTADGTGANDRIYVLLTEDHIFGYQQDYVNGAQANYDHRHALRSYISDRMGDEVQPNTMGTSITRNYSITVPMTWNIDNCAAVAFVGEPSVGATAGPIYQVRQAAAVGGATAIGDQDVDALGAAFPVPANDVVMIPINGAIELLQLNDATGRTVLQQRVGLGQRTVLVDVSSLSNGLYFYGTPGGRQRSLMVAH